MSNDLTLQDRLRAVAEAIEEGYDPGSSDELREAADHIDALTAERDRLRVALVALLAPCATCGGEGEFIIDHNGPGTDGTLPFEHVPCPDCTEKETTDG